MQSSFDGLKIQNEYNLQTLSLDNNCFYTDIICNANLSVLYKPCAFNNNKTSLVSYMHT